MTYVSRYAGRQVISQKYRKGDIKIVGRDLNRYMGKGE